MCWLFCEGSSLTISRAVRPLLSFMFTSIPAARGAEKAKARIFSNYVQIQVSHQVGSYICDHHCGKLKRALGRQSQTKHQREPLPEPRGCGGAGGGAALRRAVLERWVEGSPRYRFRRGSFSHLQPAIFVPHLSCQTKQLRAKHCLSQSANQMEKQHEAGQRGMVVEARFRGLQKQ